MSQLYVSGHFLCHSNWLDFFFPRRNHACLALQHPGGEQEEGTVTPPKCAHAPSQHPVLWGKPCLAPSQLSGCTCVCTDTRVCKHKRFEMLLHVHGHVPALAVDAALPLPLALLGFCWKARVQPRHLQPSCWCPCPSASLPLGVTVALISSTIPTIGWKI